VNDPYRVVSIDLDADGLDDVLATDYSSNTLVWWHNVAPPTPFPTPSPPTPIPTPAPSSQEPTVVLSLEPTAEPTAASPTAQPSLVPTGVPTGAPTMEPTDVSDSG